MFPPCVVTVQCYLRCSVFTFHPCLRIWWFGICYAPSDSLQRSVCCVPLLGTCLRCWHILSHLPLSLCLRLPSALSRWRPCFCWFLPLPESWWAAGSIFHCHLCGWGCLPFLHPAVCRQVGVAHAFHPSLLLGEVLSRLCGWSWYRPPFVPREGPPLVSASGQVSVSLSPSPFRVTSAPFSRHV